MLEDVRCGNVGQIKRRFLAHKNKVEFGQVFYFGLALRPERLRLVLKMKKPSAGRDPGAALAHIEAQLRRRVTKKLMAALCASPSQLERAVGFGIEPPERIHLQSDAFGHPSLLIPSISRRARQQCGPADSDDVARAF